MCTVCHQGVRFEVTAILDMQFSLSIFSSSSFLFVLLPHVGWIVTNNDQWRLAAMQGTNQLVKS